MKINNKLFLITATLGLMAAGSVTALAGAHTNYVYVQNNTASTASVRESWKNNDTPDHMYFQYSNGQEVSNLQVNIEPGKSATFQQDISDHIPPTGNENINHSGSGIFTFNLNGQVLSTQANIHYHAYWVGSHNEDFISFNRLDHGEIIGQNIGIIRMVNHDGEDTNNPYSRVSGNDDTKLWIEIGGGDGFTSPTVSSTSSPMGKLSNMLQSFKL